MAGAEDGRRSDVLVGSRQGTALPATGRRSFSAAALLALLNHGAKFTTAPACSPRDTVSDTAPGFASPSTLQHHVHSLGSWLLGMLGGPREEGHGGVTSSSSVSCAEALSRFAQRRGEPWCEQPHTALLRLKMCCPRCGSGRDFTCRVPSGGKGSRCWGARLKAEAGPGWDSSVGSKRGCQSG